LTRKKRFIILTTVLTFFSALLLNNLYASDFLVDTAKNLIDTNSVNLSDVYHNNHFLDIASILPFHSTYLTWDTTTIHPYHFDLTKMTDTVTLVLADHKDCGFVIPVAGFVTSPFGQRTRSRYHYGIDLKLDRGDEVSAAFDGVVRISEWSSSYGNCVVVRHYNGLETLYAHLTTRKVVCGQQVKAGQLLGLGGTTGRSSGPHLHFEVRYKGQAIDPNRIIDFNDTTHHTLKSDTLNLTAADFTYISEFHSQQGRRIKHRHGRRGHYHYTYTYAAPAHSSRHHHGSSHSTASSTHVSYTHSAYTIRRGDSMSKIAVRNGTTVNRICQLNRISRNATLKPGHKLKLK
jgi:hypothetical protein